MGRIILDIETSGFDFEHFDKTTQEYLMKYANSEEEETKVIESLAFYPLTGEVVTIGMLNPDTDKGVVYFQSNTERMVFEEDGIVFESGSEAEILQRFWEVVNKYEGIITFNGRTFDAPFLIIRSAVHKIKPTRNLLPNRYSDEHIDLLDRLTFYGAMKRRFNLDTWCKTFGIPTPKDDINGYMVSDMFKSGKVEDIARYCVKDLKATKELFFVWQEYIKI
ncbi:MAG: ribonuclease H-like domain-containing protein [Thermodesulfovibrionales bacterium]|nr:ribonuclease H-like domain-containing protein [Thermodesulfovibrionales bacterium]